MKATMARVLDWVIIGFGIAAAVILSRVVVRYWDRIW